MNASSPYLRTRVKFCGLTRAGDIRLAGELGADAIGLVFAEGSPRQLGIDEAASLRGAAGPFLSVVALFMDNDPDDVERVIQRVRPHLLQFHGSETDAECRRWGLPFFKSVAMGEGSANGRSHALGVLNRFPSATGFLFDGHGEGEPGGQGKRFDWASLPADLGRPWMLAGGLSPDTVCDAVVRTRCWGVDVSTGIESAPGVKDGERMKRFLEEVRSADCTIDK